MTKPTQADKEEIKKWWLEEMDRPFSKSLRRHDSKAFYMLLVECHLYYPELTQKHIEQLDNPHLNKAIEEIQIQRRGEAQC